MLRAWFYVMVIPGVLGLAAMAAIVLPYGDDLSLARLLVGCAAMIVVQVAGGFVGGRVTGRRL
jgi:hypothetical protein